MSIAITAATGQLGRLIVGKLVARGLSTDIVAVVRNPDKAADLGVPVRVGDYTDSASLEKAFQGIDTLLLISSNEIGQRATQHQNAIDAAKRAGVRHIVYTSLLHADRSTISLAEEHRQTEQALAASGIPFTLLRNGWYTENYTGSIGGALAGGAFIGSAGQGKLSLATRADFADAAVAVLTSTGHEGRVYELAGDSAVTLTDLAAEVAKQTGRDLPYRDLPSADYAKALASFGVPEGFAHAIAGWDVEAAKGALFDDSRQLSALIGRPTTSLPVAVTHALAATSE
ncbi:MAG TPA: SDR family NAD(P)-dependent oxidoreductase [Gemmatimonas aurantiaca]|uniref:NAD(P)H--quinone oxidoreductase n=2 Tax=Gemmatimonas aurantiaca TaxID=173480 RepID=C1A8J1_GEMAT|nr:SDR family oxidoreductase [Gemmatimonas aurantiaca]BAH38551.1 NAD(P)H--quinone oxidoreductase [Gemmatimonas aurantiaca T-27]HCT57326.1 SDR family NAD(P)-dependent oxidoreductase [Gemmatimonas aurantiaca]